VLSSYTSKVMAITLPQCFSTRVLRNPRVPPVVFKGSGAQ